MTDEPYVAFLGFEDEGGIPTTRIIGQGSNLSLVFEGALAIYKTFLLDNFAVGRMIGAGDRVLHGLEQIADLRMGIYQGERLIVKLGGEQVDPRRD